MNYDDLPKYGKVSKVGWLQRHGMPTHRPICVCCGGSQGIRRAWRKFDKRRTMFNNHYSTWITRGRKPRKW